MQTQSILSFKSPLGPPVEILKHIFPSKSDKPRVSFVAGIHGDELEGLYICHKLLRFLMDLEISTPEAIQGEINIYPAVNPQALENATRLWPFFCRDINRTFGSGQSKSIVEETSHTIFQDLQSSSDIVIDLHSSNLQLMELPQVRIIKDFEKKLLPIAKKCNVDLIWVHPHAEIFESTLGFNLNISKTPTLVLETGICLRINPISGDQVFDGMLSLLHGIGVLDIALPPTKQPQLVEPENVFVIQTHHSGLFIKQVELGKTLEEGEKLGKLINPLDGSILEEFFSPCSGLLFTVREHPLAHKGSTLARIAKDIDKK